MHIAGCMSEIMPTGLHHREQGQGQDHSSETQMA